MTLNIALLLCQVKDISTFLFYNFSIGIFELLRLNLKKKVDEKRYLPGIVYMRYPINF